MNMKKNFKRFFTLDRHASAGFTLVELIVVIAILAILAGVAIPAYSGYVKKAERAGDEQLLAAVNTAFAAACAANGTDNYNVAEIPTFDVDTMELTHAYKDDFDTFFAGNENSRFKVFTALAYVNDEFVEGENVSIGDKTIAVSKELADAMKNNTFSDLGAGVLTSKVDKVSDIAAALIDHTDAEGNHTLFFDLVSDTDYLMDLMGSLDMEPEEFEAFVTNDDGTVNSSVLANSLVLSAAQKTEGMDTSFLGTSGYTTQLRNDLNNPEKATDAMAKLALTYGMYTSYVKNNPDMVDQSEALLEQNTFTGMTGILETIEGGKPEGATMSFSEYMQSPQGQADLNAYMASMQVINDSANQSPASTKDILENGFTDPDLVAALNGLLGGN